MVHQDPALKRHFKAHKGTVTSLSFNPSGKQLASSSEDHSIMMWNISAISSSLRYVARKLPVNYVSFSPRGNLMASCQGPFVRLWVPSVQGKSSEMKAHVLTCLSVNFSSDGNNIITSGADKNIKLWSTATQKYISSLPGHNNWVRMAKFSVDSTMIVSCSDDRTIKLWDKRSGKIINTFFEKRGVPNCVDFHPFGSYIGVAMSHNVVKLYDLKEMKLLQYYSCHSGATNTIAFHPNGHFLLSGSDDCTNKVIDLIEGRAVYTLQGHKEPVTAVAFTKCGEFFATGSADKQVLFWESNLIPSCSDKNSKSGLRKSLETDNCLKTKKVSAKPLSHDEIILDEPKIEDTYCAKNYQNESESYSDQGSLHSEKTFLNPCNKKSGGQSENVEFCETCKELGEVVDTLVSENERLTKMLIEMEEKVSFLEEMIGKDTFCG